MLNLAHTMNGQLKDQKLEVLLPIKSGDVLTSPHLTHTSCLKNSLQSPFFSSKFPVAAKKDFASQKPELTLQFIFFDGEEALVKYGSDDN